jgi:hypothetical protein
MNKAKKASIPARTDVHAISPLPVDFIIDRLTQLNKCGFNVKMLDLDRDGQIFQLTHPKMRSITTGTLRRWEGTHTRIDANTTLQLPPHWLEFVAHLMTMGVLFVFIGGCTSLLWYASILSFIASIVLSITFSFILPISKFFERFRKQALKDADKQMQLITLVLTSNLPQGTQPLLEFDGTEQSLEKSCGEGNNHEQKTQKTR